MLIEQDVVSGFGPVKAHQSCTSLRSIAPPLPSICGIVKDAFSRNLVLQICIRVPSGRAQKRSNSKPVDSIDRDLRPVD